MAEGKALVALRRCGDYENENVQRAVDELFDLCGGIERFVRSGDRVLIKVNLLMKRAPDRATTTHPAVARAIVRAVQKAGGAEVSREMATLAYFDGAGGGPITVRANPGTRKWERVRDPRVYAIDPAWRGESGESGYDIAMPINLGLTIILR